MPRLAWRLFSRRELLVATASVGALAACDSGEADGDTAAFTTTGSDPGTTVTEAGNLPPITSNDDFYVTSCCATPTVDPVSWAMAISHEGAQLATIDLPFLESLTARDREHTLECIGASPGNQAISNAVWSGLPLKEILGLLGVATPDGAIEMKFTGADGYTTALPIADLELPVWLVWRMNGVALPEQHGTTARLLVPGRYGMKNPKWITALEFIHEPYVGFWESLGWSNTAEYRPNAFIRDPGTRAERPAGALTLLGTAFAGSDPIASVECSVDGGATWSPARLTYQNGADIWTLWRFDFEVEPGEYTLAVRATTVSGALTGDIGGSDLAGYNGGMEILLNAT